MPPLVDLYPYNVFLELGLLLGGGVLWPTGAASVGLAWRGSTGPACVRGPASPLPMWSGVPLVGWATGLGCWCMRTLDARGPLSSLSHISGVSSAIVSGDTNLCLLFASVNEWFASCFPVVWCFHQRSLENTLGLFVVLFDICEYCLVTLFRSWSGRLVFSFDHYCLNDIDPATVSWIKVYGMLPTLPTHPTPPTQNSAKLDH